MSKLPLVKISSDLCRRRLIATDELRETCIRLRMAWRRRENPTLDERTLRRMVCRELNNRKEEAWTEAT